MITKDDITKVELPPDVVQFCKEHPIANCRLPVTGQLKAIGEKVVQQIVGLNDDVFNMQLESAREMGVTCVCEDKNRHPVGISTTVSLVKDGEIFDKRIVVPAGQIRKHPQLDAHHTVAIYVVGNKDSHDCLSDVQSIYVAGWLPIGKLKRWIKKNGNPPFQVKNMSLAVAPVSILNPLPSLQEQVTWHNICV